MFKASDFKLELMKVVRETIKEKDWTMYRAAKNLGVSYSVIHSIEHETMGHCSSSKMVYMLHTMGYKLEINLVKL